MWWLWILIGLIVVFVIAFLTCAIIMGKAAEMYYYGTDNEEEENENDIPKEQEEEIEKEE